MQPWKTGCVREKWERKRTCSRCEIKTNQDWEMWSSLGGERRAWDHPSLSIGVEKLQVEKVRWEQAGILKQCMLIVYNPGEVNLERSYR